VLRVQQFLRGGQTRDLRLAVRQLRLKLGRLQFARLLQALSLGGSRPLPELFAAAGIKFDFSKEMIAPLMDEVFEEWQKLSK
jgi:hypothetical protein